MIKGLTAIFGCLDKNLQVLHNLLLSAKVGEGQWAQRILKVFLAL